MINNSYYFQHLNNFPINYKGTCGLVALFIFDYTSQSEMPGTTQAFHDYLFDNFLVTLFGLNWIYDLVDNGYPMTASNIEEVLYAYLTDNTYNLKGYTKHYDKSLLNDVNAIKKLIDTGIPVLLTIINYDYTVSLLT